MEYIIVNFPGVGRDVMRDDQWVGTTNVKLSMNAGNYTFTLADPQDYTPPSIDVELVGTALAVPMVIDFEPADVSPTPPLLIVAPVKNIPATSNAKPTKPKKASKKT